MGWYKWFMLVGVIVVGGGWLAYWMWDRKMQKEEEAKPKQRSERLQKTHSELSDWAQKMAEFKGPPQRKKPGGHDKQDG